MANVDQFTNEAKANRNRFIQQGDDENNYLGNRQNYYNTLEDDYRGQSDKSYQDLAGTPGYTDKETSAINGNPNAGFNYYDPSKLTGDVDANAAGLDKSVGDYRSGLNDAAGSASSGVRGAAGKYGQDLSGAAQAGADKLGGAASDELGYQGGVYNYLRGENEGSYKDLDKGLDQAVDPNKLGLSKDFTNNYQLTDKQGENIRDVAGNTVRGQYQKLSDEVESRAAAEGNSSPAAIAASKQQLMRQGAIDAGDAMSNAELNVNNTAAQRQQTQENMRLGTEQDISGREASAAQSRYGARTGAANTLTAQEQQGIATNTGHRQAADSQAASMGYDAAARGGQANIDAAKVAGDYGYSAAGSGGQAALDASRYSGAQKLATDTGVQSTGQGLAVNADNTGSSRATGVAGARIAGQDKVRGYQTAQQGAAQQGTQTATGQQIQSQGTQGALANQATSTASQTATSNNANNTAGANANKALAGNLVSSFFADGGIVNTPTEAIIGENGPEEVIKLGNQPQAQRGRYGLPKPGMQTAQQPGMRGDGAQVPGNEPGGANGRYGQFGQHPDQQPTAMFDATVKHATQKFNDSPAGQIVGAARGRYGMQGRTDHAMNQNMTDMRAQDRQSNIDQLSQPMNDSGGDPMMARGGIVTKPTRVLLGEDGPEAVVPLSGNPDAKLTPGMMQTRRYRMTGPAMTHHPMGSMPPAMMDPHMHQSGWKKWDTQHGR